MERAVAPREASPPAPATSLPAAREAFQREYLAMLQSPGVRNNIRRVLTKGEAKDVREILSVLLPALVPQERTGGSAGPTKITLIQNRGGGKKTAIDITPPGTP